MNTLDPMVYATYCVTWVWSLRVHLMNIGRPSDYTEERAWAHAEAIEEHGSANAARDAKDPRALCKGTESLWSRENPPFLDRLTHARAVGAARGDEKAERVALDAFTPTLLTKDGQPRIDNGRVAAARLLVGHYQWRAERLAEAYKTKPLLEGVGEVLLQIGSMLPTLEPVRLEATVERVERMGLREDESEPEGAEESGEG